ncbi:traX protein [Pseudomonas syringae pv. theae ICMP 3923]|nr:conjugal transfer protein TraX [Pseudomonas syringae]EPM73570.1 traX protein [Pseudomonas syringae pv. theae ICMP 3923]MBL3870355.1 conjugal transfer protein TraX [Pseudomonas syringae pv. theae]GKQ49107.1 conjugal transfer protein TraX [Pseudomonas syringae pv. theae]
MKTEPDTTKHVDEQSPLDDKHSGTPLRRAGHVGLSILNPFSDLAVIYRRGIKPTAQKLKLLKTLLSTASATTEADAVGVSCSVAVARSGRTIEQLLTSYNRIRTAWWCLMMVSASLSVLLLAMLLLANFSLPLSTFLRATVTLLVLGAIASGGFVKTLIATYRLWQLQNRRVSVAERGTFKDFLAETRWCRLVLTRGHLK